MFKVLLASTVLFFGCMSFYAQENTQVSAIIRFEKQDNLISLKGIAANETNIYLDELDYLLLSLKRGSTGNYSKNNQSGKFSLKPKEEIELALLKQNLQKGELLKVYLFIKKNGKLISKDSVVISLVDKEQFLQPIDENSIEIRGLVIDEVRTKIGKDFYDYFHQNYQSINQKFPFYIFITEKPTMGRGSIISIKVDDKILFQFRSRADEEYLKRSAKITLQRIINYSKKRKMLYKNIRI